MNDTPEMNNRNEEKNAYFTAPLNNDYFSPLDEQPPVVKKGFAVASLVLGIFGLVCCCLGPVGLIMAILSIVFAIVDRVKAKSFRGLAIAGLIFGIIGLLLSAYMTLDYIAVFSVLGPLFEDPTFLELMESGNTEAAVEYYMQYLESLGMV